ELHGTYTALTSDTTYNVDITASNFQDLTATALTGDMVFAFTSVDITAPTPPTGLTVDHWGPGVGTTKTCIPTTVSLGDTTTVNAIEDAQGDDGMMYDVAEGERMWIKDFQTTGVVEPLTGAVLAVQYTVSGGYSGNSNIWVWNVSSAVDTGIKPAVGTDIIAEYDLYSNGVATTLAELQSIEVDFFSDAGAKKTVSFDYVWINATYGTGVSTDHNTLNWTLSVDDGAGADDVTEYRIYRADNELGPWDETAYAGSVPAGTNTYADMGKGQADATLWWYVVRANDTSENLETNTNTVEEPGGVVEVAPSLPPQNVYASLTGADGVDVTITWDEATPGGGGSLFGYYVYRDTDPAFGASVCLNTGAAVGLGVGSYVDSGSGAGTTEYYYKAKVTSGPGETFELYNDTLVAKSVLVMGAGMNLMGMDLPIDLIRPDGGFGPEGCKNATLEIQAQNGGVSVLVIRKYTAGGWVKYEPSQEPFTSYFNMYAKEGYFIQLDNDPVNEWRVAGVVFESPQTITIGSGLNLISPPTSLIRPDGGFGPEGCKNATVEIEAQNGGVSVLMIRKYTTGGWVKYEPSQEPFTSYFNMDADKGYFIQVSEDPTNEWTTSW
ncbi:MAG: hypothetical protein KAT70_09560, partial [Thermoplasmata archaeon]|nr:hypothetical protein [Thermoplasmata archaeon]